MLQKGSNYSACLIRSGSTLIAPHSSGGSRGWLTGLGARLQVLMMLCDVNDGAVFLLKKKKNVLLKNKKAQKWLQWAAVSCPHPAGVPGEALLCAHRQDDGHGSFLREEISIFKFSLCQVETDVAGRAGNLRPVPHPCPLCSDPKCSTFRDGIC